MVTFKRKKPVPRLKHLSSTSAEHLFQSAGNCFAEFWCLLQLPVCQTSHVSPSTPHLQLLGSEERGVHLRIALRLRLPDFSPRQGREAMNVTLELWRGTTKYGPGEELPESRKQPSPASLPGSFPAPRRLPSPTQARRPSRTRVPHTRRNSATTSAGALAPPRASDRSPVSRGLLAPGSGPCACAPRPARGGAGRTLSGGRGGAGRHFPGDRAGECGMEVARAVRSRGWAPASGGRGRGAHRGVGGAPWRIWGGGRKGEYY